jgi:spore coat protein H
VRLAALALLVAGCRTPLVRPPWEGDSSLPEDSRAELVEPGWPTLVINELMAENRTDATDGTGAHAPWIELFNPSPEAVSLQGWSISDDHGVPGRHRLEQLSVPAWGRLLLWADDRPELGPDHLGFTLSASGGELGLYTPTGDPADGVSFGLQVADFAAARVMDGDATWEITAEPTPGRMNGGGTGEGWGQAWAEPPAPCALVSDLEELHLLEGDTVSFTPACSGSLGSSALIEPVALPEGARWDGARLVWTTGPASGGRIDMVFAITTQGMGGELPIAEAVTFWVADNPGAADNVPVEPSGYTEEWGLPVLHVYTWSAIGQGYVAAELGFGGVLYPAMIKVRGASSSYYPKPGYTIELEQGELDIPAWGVTRDHLVLVSPFDDNSYVRQKLVYDQWAAVAEFWGQQRLTPRSFFVVLYFDGAYQGLFMALDRIDNEFLEHQGFDRDASLYKSVNHDANFYLHGSDGLAKGTLHDGYEKKEGEPEDDFADLDALVAFTGHADALGLVEGAAEHLDLQEFMDWFLLVHYALAEDSAGKNAYLARPLDADVFRYAPWDFNHAWGQDWRTYREPSSSRNYYTGTNKVFWAIQALPEANAELWERYRQMAQPGGPYDPDRIRAMVDDYYALIEPSAERDWEKWAASYTSYGGWAGYRNSQGDWTDYQGEKAYLYQWLDERAALFAHLR